MIQIHLINNIHRAGVGIARRRRKFFTILPSKYNQNSVFGGSFSAFLKGFRHFGDQNPEKFPDSGGSDKNTPLIRKRESIRGGILIWGVFLTGIALIKKFALRAL